MYHLSILNRVEQNETYQDPAFHHSPRPAQGIRENRPLGVGFVVRRWKQMATKVNEIGCHIAQGDTPMRVVSYTTSKSFLIGSQYPVFACELQAERGEQWFRVKESCYA